MVPLALKKRVEARDRLILQAQDASLNLQETALAALERGDLVDAETAVRRHESDMRALVENLRIYQAELRAQADELAASQERTELVLGRFTSLFTSMPVAALLVDAGGQLLEYNTSAGQLFGFRQRGSAPRFLHRLIDAADYQDRVWPAFGRIEPSLLEGIGFVGEAGRGFLGELQVAALPTVAEETGQFICVVIDRTEQIENQRAAECAAEALRTSEATLADSARIARLGGWEWQRVGRLMHWSQAMRTVFDLGPEVAATIEATLALCLPAQRPQLAAALARAEAGEPFEMELDMQSASGRMLRVLAVGHGEPAADGRERIIGVFQDITQQSRTLAAMNAAESASRSKSAFLSRMSHELRTPLNAVLGFAQLMRMEAEAGDLVLKPHRVVLIETAARHLLDLINEVLDVSRIESGQMAVHITRFDVHTLLQECLPLVQGLADAGQVTLVHGAVGQPLWTLGDRLRMKEVLINLLSNAVKYNRPGGRVEIDIAERDGQVCVSVADTGRGLDDTQLAELFQPFNRLGAESSGIEGSGMGLYVSRRFVELMGGHIDVTSVPGEGTRFMVTLNQPG